MCISRELYEKISQGESLAFSHYALLKSFCLVNQSSNQLIKQKKFLDYSDIEQDFRAFISERVLQAYEHLIT